MYIQKSKQIFFHSKRKKFLLLGKSSRKDKKMYFDNYGDTSIAVIFLPFFFLPINTCYFANLGVTASDQEGLEGLIVCSE